MFGQDAVLVRRFPRCQPGYDNVCTTRRRKRATALSAVRGIQSAQRKMPRKAEGGQHIRRGKTNLGRKDVLQRR